MDIPTLDRVPSEQHRHAYENAGKAATRRSQRAGGTYSNAHFRLDLKPEEMCLEEDIIKKFRQAQMSSPLRVI